MPALFSNLLSFANIAVVLFTATLGRLQVANAVNVRLFADSGCPADNPGPVCTNLPELTCCKDHVGDVAYYYTSAVFEGLREITNGTAVWTWNVDSKCALWSAIDSLHAECFETLGSFRDGYGAYWAIKTDGRPIPLPTARASVNGSASVSALTNSFPECRGSVAPDVYHIKLSADSPAIPIARKVALKMMASVAGAEQGLDALDIGELIDREIGVVKGEKLAIVQEVLDKHGDGLTDEQSQALKKLRK